MALSILSPLELAAKYLLTQHVLKPQGLERPDGRALHRYRLGSAGYAALRGEVARWRGHRHFNASSRHLGALFCLFVAEWFKREFKGGPWSWDGPCGAVETSQELFSPRDLVDAGLGYWGHRVTLGSDRSHEYLLSLILQGGIPTAFAAGGTGWLSGFVRDVMRDVENSGSFDQHRALEHAEYRSGQVPESFRKPALVALVSELALQLATLRRTNSGRPASIDLVAWLDATSPDWRENLPIAMEDEAASRLIEGLVRSDAARGGSGNLSADRLLVREATEPGYHFAIRLNLDGAFDVATILPTGVVADLGSRARLFADGVLAERVAVCLAIIESPLDEERERRASNRHPRSR